MVGLRSLPSLQTRTQTCCLRGMKPAMRGIQAMTLSFGPTGVSKSFMARLKSKATNKQCNELKACWLADFSQNGYSHETCNNSIHATWCLPTLGCKTCLGSVLGCSRKESHQGCLGVASCGLLTPVRRDIQGQSHAILL